MTARLNLDLQSLPSPCYVLDEAAFETNLAILDRVQQQTHCKIILALKAFACFHLFPLLHKTLCGTTASSLHEARLGKEAFQGEVHVCAPAYRDDEFDELLALADHLVFNSFKQWHKFAPRVRAASHPLSCGIRINPEHSEVETAVYDPCRRYSRLGVTASEFDPEGLDGISGLHFHALCEVNADALERTLAEVEKKFGTVMAAMKWINLGGGHHITRDDYDVDALCDLITGLRDRYDVEVYLEPGEAVGMNTGVLVASVLDVIHNEIDLAILDTSASTHMPDVLEMPYRPDIEGAGEPGAMPHTYRLAGNTCLAGDIIGDYSFPEPLKPGDRLVFTDMAHYTMVKNTMFNGINLPAIVIHNSSTGATRTVRTFTYEDYRSRLG